MIDKLFNLGKDVVKTAEGIVEGIPNPLPKPPTEVAKDVAKTALTVAQDLLNHPPQLPRPLEVATARIAQTARKAVDDFLQQRIAPKVLDLLPQGLWVSEDQLAMEWTRWKNACWKESPWKDWKVAGCGKDGITLTLWFVRWGARLNVNVLVTIKEFFIDKTKKEAVVELEKVRLEGINWLGRIAAFFYRKIYGDKPIAGLIESADIKPDSAVPGRFRVNLSSAPQIKEWEAIPVPFHPNHTLFDFIHVTGCRHADGGLYLDGKVALPADG